jgi:hypothetical protein
METKNYKGNSNKIGIYRIVNKITKKQYIGSTKSSFWSRKTKHLNSLKRNEHGNQHLQNSWNKYGSNSFVFEILEICELELVEFLEAYYIKKFKTNQNSFGYNIASVSEYRFKYKLSNEHNSEKSERKIKKSKDYNGLIYNERGLPKPFKIYDLQGNFICEYKSAKEYCEINGGSKSHISIVLNKRKLYYNGKIIIFSNDKLTTNDINLMKKYIRKKVDLYDLNHKFIRQFDSVKYCSNFIGCKDAEVRMCCLGKRSRIKNYITKYEN